ncbi:MAG: XRE family transcriptional regulator [Deltaproteobacteria bacterium HGW-Deltaproteobacteria-10]|nr:MAG: XRE family transcriptional regulator [Deltaproteobacteria bacterium HGW-Deltaproteobacteria-10]
MADVKKTAVSLGEKMKKAREKMGWSISDLAHETGYQVSVLKSVEDNSIVPPVALVLQLSRALKFNMEDWEAADGKKASAIRSKSHKKRVASYAYEPLTEAGARNHLSAYLVTIDAGTEHKGVEYKHKGEEFIYVLKGGLVISVGDNLTVLSKGDSIHFNSGLHHKLSNPNQEATKLLVTIYTP